MKSVLYILLAISMASCTNNKKVETAQGYVATPNGLADLQKSASTTTATPTATTNNLLNNPEHGQPGHDCSIPVGAPLKNAGRTNTPVAQTTQANVVQTNAPQATAVQNPANGNKLNPPHGQPGHDCAVAVGAPLSAKSSSPAPQSTQPKVNVSPPAVNSSVPMLNEKGQRLNPAHGQPGHDCAVAVGAPLT